MSVILPFPNKLALRSPREQWDAVKHMKATELLAAIMTKYPDCSFTSEELRAAQGMNVNVHMVGPGEWNLTPITTRPQGEQVVSAAAVECLQCGETRGAIRNEQLICGTVDYYGELGDEWPRHRFKPWTAAELAEQARVEQAMVEHWAGFAEYFDAESKRMNALIAAYEAEHGRKPTYAEEWELGWHETPTPAAHPPLSATAAESDTATPPERESAADEGISHE